MEKTLAIIKPNAVADRHIGKIIDRIEQEGFKILAMQYMTLTREKAEGFYAVHKERPFFGELVTMMISGPVVVLALEKDNAVQTWRDVMGATDPNKAAPGTLRKLYGKSIGENATHGSDSVENGQKEVVYFFADIK